MVRGILFKDKRFDTKDDNNLMSEMTENTIILCANYRLMSSLAEEIVNTINGNAEYNDYDCDAEDVGKAKYELNFGLQKVIDVNGQKIILCLEPAMVYRAKQIKDIWFADALGKNDTYEESVYPMTIFKGSNEIWDSGLDEVYRTVVGGRYGCYDGSWVASTSTQKSDFQMSTHTDKEKYGQALKEIEEEIEGCSSDCLNDDGSCICCMYPCWRMTAKEAVEKQIHTKK